MRTPSRKRVKTKVMTVRSESLQGAALPFLETEAYQWQDDVTVIGVQLLANCDIDSGGEASEGDFQCFARVGRNGKFVGLNAMEDGDIAIAYMKQHVEAGVAEFSGGGNMVDIQTVMFPEGFGMDFDEGELIYIHCGGFNRMVVGAADMSMRSNVIIYYVEQ